MIDVFPIPAPPLSELPVSLQEIVQQIVRGAVPQAQPILLHMLGIPGAGKSSFLKGFSSLWGAENATYLGFDQLMERMPDYSEMMDKKTAFSLCELPAREAGYRTLAELLRKRANILFDNGGSAASHLDMLRFAKGQGYRVAVVAVKTHPEVARARILLRYETTGQYTPDEYLEDRALKIDRLYQAYKSLASWFYEIESRGNTEADKTKFMSEALNTAQNLYEDLKSDHISSMVGT